MQHKRADKLAVAAADIVRNFSRWRAQANQQPVFIMTHGHETHALLSMAEYERLIGERSSGSKHQDDLVELADWIDEALLVCDAELHILHANRVAGAVCRVPANALAGQPLLQALPQISGSLMEVHARRTVVGGEPSAADVPSPFTPGAWIRLQCFPFGKRNVLMFRDITEDVQRHRLADVKEAILAAMGVHGAVGYIRLSVRGTIERADQPICEILALPEDRLRGIPVSDLIVVADRVRFRENLETVLSGGRPCKLNVCLLTNRGEEEAFTVGMVQLHGAYGAEGAVMILTRVDSEG